MSGENGSKFNIFGFNFDDKAKVLSAQSNNDLASFNWLASGLGTNFVVTPAGASTLISGKFAYSKYGIDYKEFDDSGLARNAYGAIGKQYCDLI